MTINKSPEIQLLLTALTRCRFADSISERSKIANDAVEALAATSHIAPDAAAIQAVTYESAMQAIDHLAQSNSSGRDEDARAMLVPVSPAIAPEASELPPLRYTNDGALAECPCCGSLDVGGAHDTVHCYGCGLSVTKPRPLQNAIDTWNRRAAIAMHRAAPVGRAALDEFIEKVCLGKSELISCAESAFYWFNKCVRAAAATGGREQFEALMRADGWGEPHFKMREGFEGLAYTSVSMQGAWRCYRAIATNRADLAAAEPVPTDYRTLQAAHSQISKRRDEQSGEIREGMDKAINTVERMMLKLPASQSASEAVGVQHLNELTHWVGLLEAGKPVGTLLHAHITSAAAQLEDALKGKS